VTGRLQLSGSVDDNVEITRDFVLCVAG